MFYFKNFTDDALSTEHIQDDAFYSSRNDPVVRDMINSRKDIHKRTSTKDSKLPSETALFNKDLPFTQNAVSKSEKNENNSFALKNTNKIFRTALDPKSTNILFYLLDFFVDFALQNNITYFLAFGSALGSYRHHDIIPWDDDIDIMVPLSQRRRLKNAMKTSEEPKFIQILSSLGKIFSNRSTNVHQEPVRRKTNFTAPYLDFFFYKENDKYIWHLKHPRTPKIHVFPLVPRPFHGKQYLFPGDISQYMLDLSFNVDECYTGYFNHLTESKRGKEEMGRLPCEKLKDHIPFVRHSRDTDGRCKEELVLGRKVLNTVLRTTEKVFKC